MDHRTDAGKQTTELAQRRMHMEPMHIPSIIMLVRSFFMAPSVLSSSILGMVALYPSHPLLSSLFRDFPDYLPLGSTARITSGSSPVLRTLWLWPWGQ